MGALLFVNWGEMGEWKRETAASETDDVSPEEQGELSRLLSFSGGKVAGSPNCFHLFRYQKTPVRTEKVTAERPLYI